MAQSGGCSFLSLGAHCWGGALRRGSQQEGQASSETSQLGPRCWESGGAGSGQASSCFPLLSYLFEKQLYFLNRSLSPVGPHPTWAKASGDRGSRGSLGDRRDEVLDMTGPSSAPWGGSWAIFSDQGLAQSTCPRRVLGLPGPAAGAGVGAPRRESGPRQWCCIPIPWLPSMSPRASHFSSLNLCFLTCKVGGAVQIKHNYMNVKYLSHLLALKRIYWLGVYLRSQQSPVYSLDASCM